MNNKVLMRALSFILIIYTLLTPLSVAAVGASDASLADKDSSIQTDLCEEYTPVLADGVEVGSRFWELFFGEGKKEDERITLLPGGEVFGVKIRQKYVTVTESKGVPALKSGDTILSINGEPIKSTSDVKRIVQGSSGNSLTIRAIHQGSEIAVEIRPSLEDGEYRLGISLRDGAAGLGTVTFIDPKTGLFGGLGKKNGLKAWNV